ncbi:MAG: sigma-E factor negative regulatory protein [Azoarcus sp.]|nr:sigma-E factor negative regulatory protein [Azoarcus sp.]
MLEMEEKLSAMFDGDVDESTARALFIRLKRDTAFRDEWDAYCLLSDVIRGGVQPEMSGFAARVMSRIEDEPTILAPHRKEARKENEPHRSMRTHLLLPVAASVMGVLAVGGMVATLYGGGGGKAPAQVTAARVDNAAPAAYRMDDGTRRDYLVAHQAMAGGPVPAAMQYIRTVSVPAEE